MLLAMSTVYPLNLHAPLSGNYSIQFDGITTLTNNWTVYLKDSDQNTMTPVTDGQSYAFAQVAGFTNRFSLVVLPQGVTSLSAQKQLSFHLFPNPATTTVQVSFSQEVNGLLTLTNQLGQVVQQHKAEGLTHQLDVAALPAGIYYLTIDGVVRKLVVK